MGCRVVSDDYGCVFRPSSSWLAAADVLVCKGTEEVRCSSTLFLRVREAEPGRMLLLRPFNNVCVFGVPWDADLEGGGEEDEFDRDGKEEQQF